MVWSGGDGLRRGEVMGYREGGVDYSDGGQLHVLVGTEAWQWAQDIH